VGSLLAVPACTQEQQNKISRDIQNWTGTNGVLEVYAGEKLVRRFIKVDKVSTAMGTDDGKPRATVLCIRPSSVDRGASIADFSQCVHVCARHAAAAVV
jgi:hypothetical protein